MANLTCIKHSKYDGLGAPDLSCKMCCKIYVDAIRLSQTVQIESHTNRIKTALEKISQTGSKSK
jgi:hypothetical protein